MRFLVRVFNHFKPKEMSKPLGRWNNDCNIKTNQKIDFSNEDHCGPCGNTLLKDKIKDMKEMKDIK